MNRLTHERNNGIKTGYWSPNKKDELIERLAAYENTGLTPEEIMDGKLLTGWIPVSERLPEYTGESVIAWDEYRKRCVFAIFDGLEWEIGRWSEPAKVTAWMPLPEPYKEVEHG